MTIGWDSASFKRAIYNLISQYHHAVSVLLSVIIHRIEYAVSSTLYRRQLVFSLSRTVASVTVGYAKKSECVSLWFPFKLECVWYDACIVYVSVGLFFCVAQSGSHFINLINEQKLSFSKRLNSGWNSINRNDKRNWEMKENNRNWNCQMYDSDTRNRS